jgi:drug/metabolite transporter (DMT)-like permease
VALPPSALGALCALGSALAWAVIGLLVRTLAPHLSSVTINAVRSLAGAAVLIAWVLLTAGHGPITGMPLPVLGLLAMSIVVASTIGDTVFFESTRALGLARAMTVAMVYPLLSALLAALLLGDPLTPPVLAGAVITLLGIALIVSARDAEDAPVNRRRAGVLAALGAALAWAVSVVMLKAPMDHVDPVTAQAVRLPVAGLALLVTPWGWASPGELRRNGGPLWGRLGLVSALTLASSVLFVAGIKHAGVTVTAVLSSTAPLFALPLGALFLRERPGARAVAGAALTVLGIAVLHL